MSYSCVLFVLLVACYGGASVFSGMTGQLGRALQRLARTGPEPFKLMPGLTLTPSAHWNLTRPTVHPRGPTLVESVTDVLRTHRLQWKVAPGLQVSLYADDKGMFRVQAGSDNEFQDSSRTFGMMRRMKLVLLPIMYKLGVITTLLVLLTAFALKGLTIGIILIVMTSVGLLSKVHHGGHYGGHDPHKEVHVHVHGGHPGSPHYWDQHPWDRQAVGTYPIHSTTSPWAQYIS